MYQEQGSVLVFVEKQESADDLLKDLMKAGYDCISLHGGIDQYDRDSAVVDFKNGKIKLMVNYGHVYHNKRIDKYNFNLFKYLDCNVCGCSWFRCEASYFGCEL